MEFHSFGFRLHHEQLAMSVTTTKTLYAYLMAAPVTLSAFRFQRSLTAQCCPGCW